MSKDHLVDQLIKLSPESRIRLRKAVTGRKQVWSDPEWDLHVREERLGLLQEIVYHMPVGVADVLGRLFPHNEGVSAIRRLHSFRQEHGLLRNHPPRMIQ
jgi:hypothetical protein